MNLVEKAEGRPGRDKDNTMTEGCNFPKRLELSFLAHAAPLERRLFVSSTAAPESLKVRALPKASSKGFDSKTCFSTSGS